MWLYRAYSGNLYHSGEQPNVLPEYSHGDVITTYLDLDNRTLSFAKNAEDPIVAFSNLPQVTTGVTIKKAKNNAGFLFTGCGAVSLRGVLLTQSRRESWHL